MIYKDSSKCCKGDNPWFKTFLENLILKPTCSITRNYWMIRSKCSMTFITTDTLTISSSRSNHLLVRDSLKSIRLSLSTFHTTISYWIYRSLILNRQWNTTNLLWMLNSILLKHIIGFYLINSRWLSNSCKDIKR